MCSFCAIAAKEKPAVLVLEEEEMIAFLDYRPLFWGHSLLIPRRHYETMADLPARLIGPLFEGRAASPSPWRRDSGPPAPSWPSTTGSARACHTSTFTWCPAGARTASRGFFWPRTRYDSDEQAHQVAQKLRAVLAAPLSP